MSGCWPQQSTHDPVESHATTTGASVLCYAVAPHTGELFFLLGKESGGAADARLDCDHAYTWPNAARRPAKDAGADDRPRRDEGADGICTSNLDTRLHGQTSGDIADRAPARGAYCIEGDDDSDGSFASSDPSQDSSQDSDDDLPDDADHLGSQTREQGDKQTRRAVDTCDEDEDVIGDASECVVLNLCTPTDAARVDARARATGDSAPSSSQRRLRRTHRWCDFGGRIEPGESQEEAAAREFFEETLGVVCTDSCARSAHRDAAMGSVDVGAPSGLHGDADRRALAADLAAGRYAFKVRTCLNHGADPTVPRRHHVTFVKRIPWTPSVVLQFARLRCELAAVARDTRRDCAPAKEERFDTARLAATSSVRAPHQVVGPELADEPDCSTAQHGTNGLCRHRATGKGDVGDEPAARAALRPDGRVRDECIEKDYLQFWSVRRLRQALDNGGCFRREHLRPLFMPTIAVVLDVMAPRRVHRNVAAAAAIVQDDVPWHPSTRLTLERVGKASVYTVRCRAPLRRVHHHVHAQPQPQEPGACDHDPAGGYVRERHDKDADGAHRNINNDNNDGQQDATPPERGPSPPPAALWRYRSDTRCVLN